MIHINIDLIIHSNLNINLKLIDGEFHNINIEHDVPKQLTHLKREIDFQPERRNHWKIF